MITTDFIIKYAFLTREASLRLSTLIQYLIIVILRITAIGTLPNSPYSVIKFVDFLTPRMRLKDFVYTSSILLAS